MKKLDGEPRLQGASASVVEWARKVVQAVNSVVDAAAGFVKKAGDTMTGNLTVSNIDPSLTLNALATSTSAIVDFRRVGQAWWTLDAYAPDGDFYIDRYVSGVYANSPIRILNSTGEVTFSTNGSGRTILITDTGGSGANLRLTGNGATTPSKSIRAAGGSLEVINSAYSAVIAQITDGGIIRAGNGYRCTANAGGTIGANIFNIYWSGSSAKLWIDGTDVGAISLTSDERVKVVLGALAADVASYRKIKPIAFRFKDVGIFEDLAGPAGVRWGFSAQNLLTCIPKAVNGEPDAVLDDGTPQPMSIDDRPILAQTVLMVQRLLAITDEQRDQIAQLRSELDTLKGA